MTRGMLGRICDGCRLDVPFLKTGVRHAGPFICWDDIITIGPTMLHPNPIISDYMTDLREKIEEAYPHLRWLWVTKKEGEWHYVVADKELINHPNWLKDHPSVGFRLIEKDGTWNILALHVKPGQKKARYWNGTNPTLDIQEREEISLSDPECSDKVIAFAGKIDA